MFKLCELNIYITRFKRLNRREIFYKEIKKRSIERQCNDRVTQVQKQNMLYEIKDIEIDT